MPSTHSGSGFDLTGPNHGQWYAFDAFHGIIEMSRQQCRPAPAIFHTPKGRDGAALFDVVRFDSDRWLVSSKWGLLMFDSQAPTFSLFEGHNHKSLGDKAVFTLARDEQYIYLPEHAGRLVQFDVSQYQASDINFGLLEGDHIVKVQPISHNRLAIAGKAGLYVHDLTRDSTYWWSFGELLANQPLEDNQLTFHQDTLALAIGNVIWSLDINHLPRQLLPLPYVRGIHINHKKQQPSKDHRYLQSSIEQTKQLTLDHHVLHMALEVSARHLGNFPVGFEYRLWGLNEQWVTLEQNRLAHFTSLPAGNYRFEVRSTNRLGQTSSFTATLPIEVKPSPFASTEAKLTYFLSGLVLIAAMLWRQQRNHHRRQQILEKQVKKRTDHLNSALEDLACKSTEVSALLDDKETLLQEKDTMLAAISHELKTPLTTLMVPIQQLLEQPEQNEKNQRLLQMMRRSTTNIKNNVEQILQLARLSSARQLDKQPLPLSQLVRYVCNLYKDFAAKHQIELLQDIQADIQLEGDLQALELLISNLLSNAIVYSRKTQSVTISLQFEKAKAVLSVRDRGVGMTEQTKARLFDAFEQGEDQRQGGSGLGMSLVRAIVESHQGTIKVDSRPGHGSRFTITLPDACKTSQQGTLILNNTELPEMVTPQPDQTLQPCTERSNAPCLLVVDDEPEIATLLSIVLGPTHNLVFANNGPAALDILSEHPIDLILCDQHMPYMQGAHFTKISKQRPSTSHIPVIILSADSQEQNQRMALDSMADAFIPKPFDYHVLQSQINSLLANRRLISAAQLESFETTRDSGNNETGFLAKLAKLLADNFRDPQFKLSDHLGLFDMSERNFRYKVKALTGESPTSYLYQYRLEKAKTQLESDMSLEQIAQINGFKNIRHFRTRFVDYLGMTPAEMRKQLNRML